MSKSKKQPDEARVEYFNMGPWPTYVGFTTCGKAFKRELKRLGIRGVPWLARERANASVHRLTHEGALTQIICIVPIGDRPVEQYAALVAHEATHVVQAIREELNRDEHLGDEAEAYLVQFIVQECLQRALDSNFEKRTEPAA